MYVGDGSFRSNSPRELCGLLICGMFSKGFGKPRVAKVVALR